jgi:putative NADPH-quinone reductase
MKKIVIINGHPDKRSLCFALAERYKKGADTAGGECQLVHLIDLKFNPILTHGYRLISELEPDLVTLQQAIKQADHLVFVYPNWWSNFPALL